MNILVVNWLDRENPQAGGAEVHLFEIFRRLAGRGHQVTLITSGFAGAPYHASIEGITVRRVGGRHTFALRGRGAIRDALRAQAYDVVVEDINKLPLYVPTLTQVPVYVIVPHLFGTTAFLEASVPVASVVWIAERAIPRVYRRAAFHAISTSTRDDLVDRGIPETAIRVIYPGVDTASLTPGGHLAREAHPTFLFIGRLKRYKGIDTILSALAQARAEGPPMRLQIAGRGDDEARLRRLAVQLGVSEAVDFVGFVDEEVKRSLLRRAWAVVFPSAKEGWGITNVEAAACGTPAIASDSPGLRESVVDGRTGLLVPHGNASVLARAMVRVSNEPALVETWGRAARRFAETLSWDRTADETESHLCEWVDASRPARKETA